MNRNLKYVVIIIAAFILNSCTNDYMYKANPLDGLVKLSEGYVARSKIEIWGTRNYFVGYNKLVVALYDSLNLKKHVTDAHILFIPEKTSGAGTSQKVSGSPQEAPDELAINGVFPGAVIFDSPTTNAGKWKLKVFVHNHDIDIYGQTGMDISVDSLDFPQVAEFKSDSPDSTVLVLSLVGPENPVIGVNNIELSLQKQIGFTQFTPDDSYSFEINPVMVGMPSDPTGNANPVSIGNGHYKGSVNLNMTGNWDVGISVKKDARIISGQLNFKIRV